MSLEGARRGSGPPAPHQEGTGLKPAHRGAFMLAAAAAALIPARTGRAGYFADYEWEIFRLESIMERFYRGKSVEEATDAVNDLVESYNSRGDAGNREIEASKAALEGQLAPQRRIKKEIEALDKRLARKPSAGDRAAVREYNAAVARRNALAAQFNELNVRARAGIEAHNRLAKRVNSELKAFSRVLDARKAALKARKEAYKKFGDEREDLAFFADLNRICARLRRERGPLGGRGRVEKALAKVLAMRRELGAWAAARNRSAKHGLVIVEAALADVDGADVPCFFIVDTGASLTILSAELVEVLGLTDKLGDEIEFSLAGAKRTKGRACVLPRLAVAGVTVRDLAAATGRTSEVGVDGLLGQSFLKRFVYMIDETKDPPLILVRRR